MTAQVVPSLTRWFNPDDLAINAWPVRYARERVHRGKPVHWAAAWRSFKGLDVQGRLQQFRPPTLVLAGERDASTTPEIMTGIAAHISGSTYVELPGTPHMQILSKPGLVAAALDDFLPGAARRAWRVSRDIRVPDATWTSSCIAATRPEQQRFATTMTCSRGIGRTWTSSRSR
jgi:3-oxoadipate enol-lactonase